jgi:hypothetical protein
VASEAWVVPEASNGGLIVVRTRNITDGDKRHWNSREAWADKVPLQVRLALLVPLAMMASHWVLFPRAVTAKTWDQFRSGGAPGVILIPATLGNGPSGARGTAQFIQLS